MNAIKINNFTKIYKRKSKKVNAVKNLSFAINQGEIFGFLGPNGAGKSTTIKAIMGLITPTKGEILINGVSSQNPQSRKKVGYLPENPSFIDSLSGLDLLLFSATMHGIDKKTAKVQAYKLLEELGLKDAAKRPIRTYSKGMVQKVGFAASIIFDPDILILDEPMSGLDPISRYEFKNKFKELKQKGKTIFFSSHIIPDVEDLCNRIAVINRGSLIDIFEMESIKVLSTSGYEIFFKGNVCFDSEVLPGEIKKITVPSKDLLNTLENLKSKGEVEIVSINPLQEDLETIFVEIINKSKING
ncbi:MAG: ABC transporter, ATP-binding protein [Desulfonauticus sp. 38_4375]|nr:MAG: ABC transporter, ATP-binding protein [Desulfonauticus sp. 38_4375]